MILYNNSNAASRIRLIFDGYSIEGQVKKEAVGKILKDPSSLFFN